MAWQQGGNDRLQSMTLLVSMPGALSPAISASPYKHLPCFSTEEELKGNAARTSLILQEKNQNRPQKYDLGTYFKERHIYLPPLI